MEDYSLLPQYNRIHASMRNNSMNHHKSYPELTTKLAKVRSHILDKYDSVLKTSVPDCSIRLKIILSRFEETPTVLFSYNNSA